MSDNTIPPLVCPHCGTVIDNKKAKACPHCGSDERTGWGDKAGHHMSNVPKGWSAEDDFSYEEFLEKEFGISQQVSTRVWLKRMSLVVLIIVLAICMLG